MNRDEALTELRRECPPGTTINLILRNVSRSGMSRRISALVNTTWGDGTTGLRQLDGLIDAAGIAKLSRHGEGVTMTGCGMDMGFHLVYTLSRTLYPDGFGVEGEGPMGHTVRPPTKDKAAAAVALGFTFRGRNGDTSGWDNDGGYALKHRWL